ncbi:hypothetical protein AXF42_Ash002953 [Apostasia shenzhenica]|uniref:IST1-like protein n=1 Tax=Apostasia shenzhenica TaxID=1088818 RepID=A0A2I0A7S4_9ASPA|nr:hypothetical protein AXF42_Ash002953 [Apostasia shenzhenica]
MLDSFFNKGFKAARCKTLLKLTTPRIKLLRNRREIQLKQMRKDIANLLQNGQEATARIRVEHIIREENMMAAQEIIELFCELIAVRLPIIEMQRECPLDLKEAISSVCFAAPRCSDLPELQQVQMMFAAKYGKEFVVTATELMPDCGVNRQIIELLSVRAPSVEAKLKLLKEIAEEHEVDWDATDTKTEFQKPHEDLLNGPNHITAALPLPKESHDDSLKNIIEEAHEEPDADAGLGSWDFPEVPKASVQATPATPDSPPSIILRPPPPPPFYTELEQVETDTTPKIPTDVEMESPIAARENKQFVPFISPPSLSVPLPAKQSEPAPSLPVTKLDAKADLQDVLIAARNAAETAEQAATAARAVASLAQVRISELEAKNRDLSDGSSKIEADEMENPTFNHNAPFDHTKPVPDWDSVSPTLSSHGLSMMESMPPPDYQSVHVPQRSTSLEDDPYFSYPNLFSRQDSNRKSDVSSSTENLSCGPVQKILIQANEGAVLL